MKPQVRDTEDDQNGVSDQNLLDLLNITIEEGEHVEDQLCEWVWLSHMDEPNGEPHHKLQHVSELEIDVMVEEYTLERTIRSIIFRLQRDL